MRERKYFSSWIHPIWIKAVRNNMINYNFHFNDKVSSWKDVTALYNIDSKNPFRCCPKLTKKHLSPNNFEKMKVKLATQVLSHTVSAAMLMALSSNVLPPSAAGTAELMAKFEIFDCLNSSVGLPKCYVPSLKKHQLIKRTYNCQRTILKTVIPRFFMPVTLLSMHAFVPVTDNCTL
jgi:hypothetical protein